MLFHLKLLLTSKIITAVGGDILTFSMLLFLVDMTGSAATIGIVLFISQLPPILIAPFAGVLSDRLDKKRLIVLFDVLKALSDFAFFFLLLTGAYTLVTIALLRTFKVIANMFAGNVFSAAVPLVAGKEGLIAANGYLTSIQAVGLIAGSASGALLYDAIGILPVALASGFLFLLSAAISSFIQIPPVKQAPAPNMLRTVQRDLKESFFFLKKEKPLVMKLALISAVMSMIYPAIFQIALPFIVTVNFGESAALPSGVSAIGILVGGMAAKRLRRYLTASYIPMWMFILGAVSLPSAFVFLAPFTELPGRFGIFVLGLTLLAFFFALRKISTHSFIQQEIPAHLLGKVNALLNIFVLVATPIGVLLTGLLIEAIPLSAYFFGIIAITWLMGYLCQRLLKFSA